MNANHLQLLFDRLADGIAARDAADATRAARSLFYGLLKVVYARLRGEMSAARLRALLDVEIDIGGEEGDFRHFSDAQMIDLFTRGGIGGRMQSAMQRVRLSAAVDVAAVAGWFETVAEGNDPPSVDSLRFVHAWLTLLAVDAGILDPDRSGAPAGPIALEKPPAAMFALPQAGEPFTEPVTGMTFVHVPGGTFSMGDTFDEGVEDETPVHAVTLSPFYMAVHPVTQRQWGCLVAENPSSRPGEDHPVEQVALGDVTAFIEKLNSSSPPGVHFDLPTEAQWEYAARSGGQDERYAGGSDPDAVAWFEDNNTGGTAPVGRKSPNGLGLYDMSGNVWEWCRDVYHPEAYRRHDKTDPVWVSGGRDRVIRGGSWHLDAWSARCSRRFRFDPELFGPALGFRLVMTVGGQRPNGAK